MGMCGRGYVLRLLVSIGVCDGCLLFFRNGRWLGFPEPIFVVVVVATDIGYV